MKNLKRTVVIIRKETTIWAWCLYSKINRKCDDTKTMRTRRHWDHGNFNVISEERTDEETGEAISMLSLPKLYPAFNNHLEYGPETRKWYDRRFKMKL